MPVRALTLLTSVIVQAVLGGITGHLLGGTLAAAVAATLAVVASIAVALAGRRRSESAYRQGILSAILIALHISALYTLGDDGKTLIPGANTQLLAAGVGLVACVYFARRLRAASAMSEPHDRRTVLVEDDDDRTIELDPPQASASPRVEPASLGAIPPPRLRSPLALGVVSTALFIAATLFWIRDDGRHDGLGSNAAARELPSPQAPTGDTLIAAPGPVTTSADVPEPDAPTVSNFGAGAGAAVPAAGTGRPAAPARNALAPSAARRECMAQIESAHLFLQIARESADQADYTLATQGQITRMLKSRPVGPRTLDRIAERMWDVRDAPERGAAWWSSQFSRCEAARSGGSWYVVKG